MSWKDERDILVGTLTSEGYKEIPYRLEQDESPMSLNNKDFVLKAEATPIEDLTSNFGVGVNVVRLEITYVNVTNDQRAENYDLWLIIIDIIRQLVSYQGFAQPLQFEDTNDDRSIGTALLYYGIHSCEK